MPEPQRLQDARQNEKHAQDALYEACVAFVNAGLADGAQVVYPDARNMVTVVSWSRAWNWDEAMDNVARHVKLASAARKNRKTIQQNLLDQAGESQ